MCGSCGFGEEAGDQSMEKGEVGSGELRENEKSPGGWREERKTVMEGG